MGRGLPPVAVNTHPLAHRLAVLLPLRAREPDVHHTLFGLLLGAPPGTPDEASVVDSTADLRAACDSLAGPIAPTLGVATLHWLPEALGLISVVLREGMRIVAAGAAPAGHPAAAPASEDSDEAVVRVALQAHAAVRQVLALGVSLLGSLRRLFLDHPPVAVILLNREDVLSRLVAALGVAWLYAQVKCRRGVDCRCRAT